jgi:hypothetical protein
MNHLTNSRPGRPVPRQRPTSLDLILQARALRHQWFVSALARLSAQLARLVPELAARGPIRAVSERLRLSDRVAM